jgi:hypothetical protein
MTADPPYLQSYVVPLCTFTFVDDNAYIQSVLGTCFFINGLGDFITARHVLDEAERIHRETGHFFGLIGKAEDGTSASEQYVGVSNIERAPTPFDIVLGHAVSRPPTALQFGSVNVTHWQDVASFGYPATAHGGDPRNKRINIRSYKGYIHRATEPSDMKIGDHPHGFEVSFTASPGMSGAPLFIPNAPKDIVIGVMVSSFRGETIEAEIEEILEDGTVFKESRRRIEEYGFAHDIRPLLDWKPDNYNGQTLLEISKL